MPPVWIGFKVTWREVVFENIVNFVLTSMEEIIRESRNTVRTVCTWVGV